MTRDGTVRRGPKTGITERGEAAGGENTKFSEVMEDHILERDQMKERFSVKKSITKRMEGAAGSLQRGRHCYTILLSENAIQALGLLLKIF